MSAIDCLSAALNHYGENQDAFERVGFKQYTFAAAIVELDQKIRQFNAAFEGKHVFCAEDNCWYVVKDGKWLASNSPERGVST